MRMSADIYTKLGTALAAQARQAPPSSLALPKAARAMLTASAAAPPPEPIVLLNKFPIILNPSDYANPLSTANPGGDLRSLWRFRQLVDPLPQFASFYTASTLSTEGVYTAIVGGAVVKDTSPFVTSIVANAQRAVEDQTYADMDGTPGRWRPVFAVPDDWYNCFKNNKTSQLTLDLSGMTLGGPPPVPRPGPPPLPRPVPGPLLARNLVLKPQRLALNRLADTVRAARLPLAAIERIAPLAWKTLDAKAGARTQALSSDSKVTSAQVNYLMVSLSRPWLDMLLFATGGWYLDGQVAGFCSSGSNDGSGVMPLVPSSIIIGTSAFITATWSQPDAQLIANATKARQQLFLGPLPLNSVATTPADPPLYVLGWVMSQVPFSPRLAAPDAGA